MPIYIKSVGNMYYLYLTKYNYSNVCFLIDTKIQNDNKYPKIVVIYLGFKDNLFNDTLFLGEMIKDK